MAALSTLLPLAVRQPPRGAFGADAVLVAADIVDQRGKAAALVGDRGAARRLGLEAVGRALVPVQRPLHRRRPRIGIGAGMLVDRAPGDLLERREQGRLGARRKFRVAGEPGPVAQLPGIVPENRLILPARL